MGFRGLLELLGIALSAPSVVILDEGICPISLAIDSPDLIWEYDDNPRLMALGDPLLADVASPALYLAYEDKELTLVCPY